MISLPGLDNPIAPMGLGTWAWGDETTWGMDGYDPNLTNETIAEAWAATREAGISLIDTAEVYGKGRSESIISTLNDGTATIATKFYPAPWKWNLARELPKALDASMDRLGIDVVDLYQIHGPISLRSHAAMAEALAGVVRDGRVRAVGVSNYSTKEMRAIHGELAARGVPLATNQVEYSLLRRRPETTGLLAAATDLGVVILAYSPLAQGRLTGKYSAASPPPGRRSFSDHPWELVDPVLEVTTTIAEGRDCTPAQVALAWIIAKGAVPIPGAKNADQARANAGALEVDLTGDDVARLDAVALDGTRSLLGRIWQHG